LFQNREDLFFMKNKTKVILGLAAMLAGTAGIAGVSTFAWFTTQNTAKLTFTDAVVRGDVTNISVTWDSKQPVNSHIAAGVVSNNNSTLAISNNPPANSDLVISGAATEMIDLSGNGNTFYHPKNYNSTGKLSGTNTRYADSIQTITENDTNRTFFVTFNVLLTNNANLSTDVYTTSGCQINDRGAVDGVDNNEDASTRAWKATRLSIWENDMTDNRAKTTLRSIWHPHSDSTTQKFLNDVATGGTHAFGIGDSTIYEHTVSDTGTTDFEKVFNGSTIGAAPAASTTAVASLNDGTVIPTYTGSKGQYITHLNALQTKSINISMWIEGTDPAGTELCINGHVGLVLEFGAVERTAA